MKEEEEEGRRLQRLNLEAQSHDSGGKVKEQLVSEYLKEQAFLTL